MKKCPNCGKEYPDEFERCLTDGGFLVCTESQAGITPPIPQPVTGLSERQVRVFEVILVCLVAFGGSILSSTYTFLYPGVDYTSSGGDGFSWVIHSFRQISALALVWYVLLRRKKTFADLGLSWSVNDIGPSILLKIGGTVGFYAVFDAIYYCGLTSLDHHTTNERIGQHLFSGGIFASTILFQFVNPFFEELIVRAYFMTEIKALTGSVSKAILASTLLQTSYHFYQGAPAAFGHGATFLIFSIFYAKTNRIAPVILAHLYTDVLSTMLYWYRHH